MLLIVLFVCAVEAGGALKAAFFGEGENGFSAVARVGVHFENFFDADAVYKVADIHFDIFIEHVPDRARRVIEFLRERFE